VIRTSSFAPAGFHRNSDEPVDDQVGMARAPGIARFDVAEYAKELNFGGSSLAGVIVREIANDEENIELASLQWPQQSPSLEIRIVAQYRFAPDVASAR
jgi:hypothetical protein